MKYIKTHDSLNYAKLHMGLMKADLSGTSEIAQ